MKALKRLLVVITFVPVVFIWSLLAILFIPSYIISGHGLYWSESFLDPYLIWAFPSHTSSFHSVEIMYLKEREMIEQSKALNELKIQIKKKYESERTN